MKIPRPKQWYILAGVLLSRPPLLLPDLHPFEERVQQYQEMIERHQYTRFPIEFFFKQGSIDEKMWRQQHQRDAKKSGSGILRPTDDQSPEWIIGGKSDEQVLKSRIHAPKPTTPPETAELQEEKDDLTDGETRDLEQFAGKEQEIAHLQTEIPQEVNIDLHRLEREPRRTLYCLVKKSRMYHERTGKSVRGWGLIEGEVESADRGNKVEPLHEV
jgi:39S mitochondrial ribosomal protein L46